MLGSAKQNTQTKVAGRNTNNSVERARACVLRGPRGRVRENFGRSEGKRARRHSTSTTKNSSANRTNYSVLTSFPPIEMSKYTVGFSGLAGPSGGV